MCGIVGIVGHTPVAPLIVDALKRLEYRGYDSAGVATIEAGTWRGAGPRANSSTSEAPSRSQPLDGLIGIGHTRWATHGVPNETQCSSAFLERRGHRPQRHHREFRANCSDELIRDGYAFTTETDTEVVAHLIARELDRGAKPADAAFKAIKRLEGAFALAIMFQGDEDLIVGARNGPPLAVGHGEGEMFLGSDAIALAPFTNSITYLEDGDWAVVRRSHVQIFDMAGEPVERKRQQSVGASFMVDKGNHRHFMEKEIHEQPEVISHTLAHYLDFTSGSRQGLRSALRPGIDRPAFDRRVRDRVSGRPGRQVLVRAAGPTAGGYRYRVGISLPRNADLEEQRSAVRVPVGRNGRYAGLAALLPQGRCADRRDRQRSRIHHRAGIRHCASDTGRPRDRGRVDQGLYLPALRSRFAGGHGGGGARAPSTGTRRRGSSASSPKRRALPASSSSWKTRSKRSLISSPKCAMCSISAATPAIRWPWKEP